MSIPRYGTAKQFTPDQRFVLAVQETASSGTASQIVCYKRWAHVP